MEREPKVVGIPVTLVDGVGLRGSDWVTVVTQGTGVLIHPSKDRITIDEQILGEVLTGRLSANVLAEKGARVLVEIKNVAGLITKLWVEKESGKVVDLGDDV